MTIALVILTVALLCFMLGGAYEKERSNTVWSSAWEEYYDQQVFDQMSQGEKTYLLQPPVAGDSPAQAEARLRVAAKRADLIAKNQGYTWFGPSPEAKAERELCLVHSTDWPDEMLEALAGENIVRSEG